MIFTSQLDVNSMACWKNTAPRLLTGATVQKAVTAREGVRSPHRGWGLSEAKWTYPGHEAVACLRELLQVLTNPKDRQKRGRHKHTLNKQEPLISEKVSRQ